MNSCPICFECVLQVKAACPDVCDHVFCLTCLTKWTKHESFCPIDRKRFKKIIRLDSKTPVEVKRHRRKKAKPLYDVTAFCEICKTSDRGDTLLLCDCCDLGYHCACLTPQLPSVPPGRWFCPTCVSVDKKLKKKKGNEKAPKVISSNEKPRKRNYLRSGTSNVFSKSNNCATSLPSVPDESSSKEEIELKKFRACTSTSQNLEDMKTYNYRKKNTNNYISLKQSQNNEVVVSKQDYRLLNNNEKVFLSPDVSLSPKRLREISVLSGGSNASVCKRTRSKFSVFQRSETFSTQQKSKRKLSYNSEVDCDVSDMLENSGDCSISSNTSGTENCDQIQLSVKCTDRQENSVSNSSSFETKCNESKPLSTIAESRIGDFKLNCVHNFSVRTECERPNEESGLLLTNTKFISDICESEQSSKENSEVPSAFENDKSSLYPDLAEFKSSESKLQLSASHGLSLSENKMDESDVMENPLVDFESRNSQYALKAKLNLQEELQIMEREKWKYFKPLKKLKSLSFTPKPSEKEFHFPKTCTSLAEKKMKIDPGGDVFNIEEYKERVKKGTWRPENIVILKRNKEITTDMHLLKRQLGASCNFNVFQGPDSHDDFVADNKHQFYMTSFNPFQSKSRGDDRSTFERNLLPAALQVDLEKMSVRSKKYILWEKIWITNNIAGRNILKIFDIVSFTTLKIQINMMPPMCSLKILKMFRFIKQYRPLVTVLCSW